MLGQLFHQSIYKFGEWIRFALYIIAKSIGICWPVISRGDAVDSSNNLIKQLTSKPSGFSVKVFANTNTTDMEKKFSSTCDNYTIK